MEGGKVSPYSLLSNHFSETNIANIKKGGFSKVSNPLIMLFNNVNENILIRYINSKEEQHLLPFHKILGRILILSNLFVSSLPNDREYRTNKNN